MLNKNDIEKIYNLANLRLKDEEVEDLAIKYQKVLDFAETIMEVDTSEVEILEIIPEHCAELREDTPQESIERDEALKNAKDREYGYFRLKKVIE